VKLRKNWNRYAYIEDIAVCKDFRGQGIGSALINISIEWAKHKNLHGLMLETQDNNLIACKFYHNCGFKIGSVDTMLYANFENNFEKAVFWYLSF
ncbi:TPA: GNAT family N-acetyltransferase, partial [Streptococcus pyogenes]